MYCYNSFNNVNLVTRGDDDSPSDLDTNRFKADYERDD